MFKIFSFCKIVFLAKKKKNHNNNNIMGKLQKYFVYYNEIRMNSDISTNTF
jgi:hypothetical protein